MSTSARRLGNKITIVTGAGSGIGRAVACALARHGAAVVVADIRGESADSVVAEIGDAGGQAKAVTVDVSDESQVRRMVDVAIETYGGLDILHNNASDLELLRDDLDVVGTNVDVWNRTLGISLTGPLLGCKHAIPHMLERGGGSIINTSSINGRRGDVTRVAYSVAKGGLQTLTLHIAAAYGAGGIRCNAVCPGVIRTRPGMVPEDPGLRPMFNSTPLARFGEPQDVAELVAFLASDESSFITGQIIEVDGGLLSQMPYAAEYKALGRRTGERTEPRKH